MGSRKEFFGMLEKKVPNEFALTGIMVIAK
jgi:hypothetical protein